MVYERSTWLDPGLEAVATDFADFAEDHVEGMHTAAGDFAEHVSQRLPHVQAFSEAVDAEPPDFEAAADAWVELSFEQKKTVIASRILINSYCRAGLLVDLVDIYDGLAESVPNPAVTQETPQLFRHSTGYERTVGTMQRNAARNAENHARDMTSSLDAIVVATQYRQLVEAFSTWQGARTDENLQSLRDLTATVKAIMNMVPPAAEVIKEQGTSAVQVVKEDLKNLRGVIAKKGKNPPRV